VFIDRPVMPPVRSDKFIVSIKQMLHDAMRPGDGAADRDVPAIRIDRPTAPSPSSR